MMFHLFAGVSYYPDGGMGDYRGAFPTTEAAQEHFASLRAGKGPSLGGDDWGQIARAGDDEQLHVVLEWVRGSWEEQQA